MSRLTLANYTNGLAGKVIKQVRWTNQEDHHSLTFTFEDETMLICRFLLGLEEELELADFKGDDLSNERELVAIPVPLPIKPLEGE